MGNDYLRRVSAYLLAITTADKLRREGVISNEDYQRITFDFSEIRTLFTQYLSAD